jgi:hypothetical protein
MQDPTPARGLRVGHGHVGLDSVIAHRQQVQAVAVLRLEPPLTERPGDLREREPGLEHLGADQVSGDVPVAEPEPGRLHAVGRELGFGAPGLLPAPPTPLRIDAVAQGVHHSVEIRADLESVHPDVIGRVGHDRDLGRRVDAGEQSAGDAVPQPLDEAGSAHASGEDGDPADRRAMSGLR